MKNVKQSIKGNNNLQIVTNNAPIIHTGKLTAKVNVVHNPEKHISDAQAQQIKEKVIECAIIYLLLMGVVNNLLFKNNMGNFIEDMV